MMGSAYNWKVWCLSMFKKKNMLLKIATLMLAVAPLVVELRSSLFVFLGEPEIPKKFR